MNKLSSLIAYATKCRSARAGGDLLYAGSITVLFGPSGCGKTTLLRCLAGLERPDMGFIRFGPDYWFDAPRGLHLPPQRRGIGFLFQDYALFPHLNVAGNITYAITHLPRPQRLQRLAEMLDLLDLAGLEQRYPDQLSGGQQQRVALARALITRPKLLLLDEPLSALDGPTRETLRRSLRKLLTACRIPAIIVTHDQIEAMTLADHVAVLHLGQVLQAGPVEEVFSRPCDLTVAQIVGVETVLAGRIVAVTEGFAHVRIGNTDLLALAHDLQPGPVHVCLRAEEITLQARDELLPPANSARNRLLARVISLARDGPMTRVELQCGFNLLALVTRPAADELGLEQGQYVMALIKTPAIHLLPR